MLMSIAGIAHAQSSVVIYGIADAGLVREGNTVANSANQAAGIAPGATRNLVSSGVGYGSRLGFRGTEDLGGGMSAFFNLENGFQADTGTPGQGGLLFGRTALVGLAGALGSISMGRQYAPYDSVIWASEPFNGGYAGKAANLLSNGYAARINNSVVYRTPGYKGWIGEAQYGFGEVDNNAKAARTLGASLKYLDGPFVLRFAYLNVNGSALVGGAAKNMVVATTYDFTSIKLHLMYAINQIDTSVARTADNRDILLGATIPYGRGKFLFSYIAKNDHLAQNRDANQLGLGYVYGLSKRSELFVAYGRMDNKNGALYTVGNSIEPGTGEKAYNLGVTHRF